MGAQHPNASQPFLHYSSPKLRTDSLQETEDLVELFGQTVGHLINARRTDILEQSKKLVQAEKAAKSAADEARDARHALAEQSDQNAALVALLRARDPDFVIPEVLLKKTL